MTRILFIAALLAVAFGNKIEEEVSFETDLMDEEHSRSLRDEIVLTFVGFGIVILGVMVKKI